jgi:hypothetical protein
VLIIIFRRSRNSVQKICTRGKTGNAEFYKGVMDRPLKWFAQMSSPLEVHASCTIIPSCNQAVIVSHFLTQKMVQPFITPPHSPDLSPSDYFLFLKLQMKLIGIKLADGSGIQEAVTDELKKF